MSIARLILPLTATVSDASLVDTHDHLTQLTFRYVNSYSTTLKFSVNIAGVQANETYVECMQIANGYPGLGVDFKDMFLQRKRFIISSLWVSI